MSLGLAAKLKKVTLKTLPVYLLGVVLIITARPRVDFFVLGLLPVLLGEGLRIWATGHLQKNQQLTTTGPYAYVKNPLYLGTFLIMVGFCLMANQLLLMIFGVVIFLLYYVPYKKRIESDRLAQRFGQIWTDYDSHVPDYWPLWTPYEHRGNARWNFQVFLNNSEHETLLMVLLGIAIISLKFFV
ncbi:MAG: isoprenylcysteine carboxylmethyltransferase family protein [Nitrospira sp.]|nr:isoprenylcysteine carboxylmethyltransferase family protein [Nitrospira sp.]